MQPKRAKHLFAVPGPADSSDPLALQSLLLGFEHADIDRRGTFQPVEVTLWSEHGGISTGAEAMLVGARPGNVLIVLADFSMNQGASVALDKRLSLRAASPRTSCHVLSSRPGMRAGDAARTSYVLELQGQRT